MYKVHFLAEVMTKAGPGWAAPVELTTDQSQDGRLVVPVPVAHSGFFSHYCLEYTQYHGSGRFTARSVPMDRQSDSSLRAEIEGRSIVFVPRLADGQPLEHQYVGQLSHVDFEQPLCEIEPADPNILDELYEKFQVIVAGCDPEIEYQGLAQMLQNQGQAQIS